MSSGERKRIDISMMLSLYEFNSYINSNMPKFLIMDELLDSLDPIGIDNVIETLLDVQERHNIDLYLVSHIPIPLENIPETTKVKHILVTKKDKISTVKYVD
jgi:ABC-type multidrug transport system ATPase subunit